MIKFLSMKKPSKIGFLPFQMASTITHFLVLYCSISAPSKNTVITTPLSYTLIWASVRSIKPTCNSYMGCACFYNSIKSTARYLASKSPLFFLFPLQQNRTAFQQFIPCHKINLSHSILIYIPIGASQHSFHFIPLTALPDFAYFSCIVLPVFPMDRTHHK